MPHTQSFLEKITRSLSNFFSIAANKLNSFFTETKIEATTTKPLAQAKTPTAKSTARKIFDFLNSTEDKQKMQEHLNNASKHFGKAAESLKDANSNVQKLKESRATSNEKLSKTPLITK